MKIGLLATGVLITASVAHGELKFMGEEQNVIVCMADSDPRMAPGYLAYAQMLASHMLDGIGVQIKWSIGRRSCPAQGIFIDMSYETPKAFRPGALAFASPLTNRIRVFYDRIRSNQSKSQISTVLAYVLAHEVTHIVQGYARHSATGIMKAKWNGADFAAMSCQTLRFADEDQDWTERGLARRAKGDQAATSVGGASGRQLQ